MGTEGQTIAESLLGVLQHLRLQLASSSKLGQQKSGDEDFCLDLLAPEYGNLQSEAIAFSKRIPAYLYQHPKDSLTDLVANEASKHDYIEAQTERFLEIVTKELLANGVIKPSGEVMTPDHKPPMTADEAKRRLIERFQIPGKGRITDFQVDNRIPIYSASIQWEIVTRVSLGVWEDGLEHWRDDAHGYAGSYDFLADRISSQTKVY